MEVNRGSDSKLLEDRVIDDLVDLGEEVVKVVG